MDDFLDMLLRPFTLIYLTCWIPAELFLASWFWMLGFGIWFNEWDLLAPLSYWETMIIVAFATPFWLQLRFQRAVKQAKKWYQ